MKNDKMITKKYSRILALNIGLTLTSTMAFAAQGPATFFGTAINNILPAPRLPTVLPNAVPTGFNPACCRATMMSWMKKPGSGK